MRRDKDPVNNVSTKRGWHYPNVNNVSLFTVSAFLLATPYHLAGSTSKFHAWLLTSGRYKSNPGRVCSEDSQAFWPTDKNRMRFSIAPCQALILKTMSDFGNMLLLLSWICSCKSHQYSVQRQKLCVSLIRHRSIFLLLKGCGGRGKGRCWNQRLRSNHSLLGYSKAKCLNN